MLAFHSFWSKPNRIRNGGSVALPDYELLTLILSALKWRQLNGPIRMITDSEGAEFFECSGFGSLWDASVTAELDRISPALDPFRFWAAGKLEALRRVQAPCVMLDADMVLWENVNAHLTHSVVAAHLEPLLPSVYPEPSEAFVLSPDYSFPAEWDFSLPAANTAFLYIPSEAFKKSYLDAAFGFMHALLNPEIDPTVSMCFAEQRILSMCAHAQGIAVLPLLDVNALNDQQSVTHLWGYKGQLAASPERRVRYCLSCVLRILSDFPEWADALARNRQTSPYLTSLV